jgi:hypothetical protein
MVHTFSCPLYGMRKYRKRIKEDFQRRRLCLRFAQYAM